MKSLTYSELLEATILEDEIVEINDVEYDNNHGEMVSIEVRKGDTKEYLKSIIEERKKIPEFVIRTSREQTTLNNAMKAIGKCTDYETVIKKLKTLTKYSGDKDFPYRSLSEILKNLSFYEEFHYSEQGAITDDILSKLIVTQTINSLENYSIVHPKLKLLMNLVGKLDSEILEGETVDTEVNEGDFALSYSL